MMKQACFVIFSKQAINTLSYTNSSKIRFKKTELPKNKHPRLDIISYLQNEIFNV